MAKKKTKKTPRQRMAAQKVVRAAGESPVVVHLLSYEITDEPMPDPRYPHLAEDVIERLHDLVTAQPKAAIPEVIEQIERHPDIPTLYNYLAVAYGQTGEIAKYEQVVQEYFQRFPDYLFARMNSAELLLRKHDYDGVADLLNHTFDIGLFYPERKRFHITEYTAFMGVVGLYHIGVGDLDAAENVLQALKGVAPDATITRRFEGEVVRERLKRALTVLERMVPGSSSPKR